MYDVRNFRTPLFIGTMPMEVTLRCRYCEIATIEMQLRSMKVRFCCVQLFR